MVVDMPPCTSSSLPDFIPEDVVDVVLVASSSMRLPGKSVLYQGFVRMRERWRGEGAKEARERGKRD